jgi:monoamine oxidase
MAPVRVRLSFSLASPHCPLPEIVVPNSEDRIRRRSEPHAEREKRTIEQGMKIHGAKYRHELAASVSVSWKLQPNIGGAWVNWPSRTGGYQLLNKPAGDVHFAGDWLSYMIAWQAGALESARKTVTDIHQRVLAS